MSTGMIRCRVCGCLEGLAGNPDLKVVLLFGYDAYKTGAARFLNQLLEPLGRSNVLIAGGHVERVLPHKRDWCVLHRMFRVWLRSCISGFSEIFLKRKSQEGHL